MSQQLPAANERAVARLQELMPAEINGDGLIRVWYAMVASGISLREVIISVRLHIASLNQLNAKALPQIDVDRHLTAKFRNIVEEEMHE